MSSNFFVEKRRQDKLKLLKMFLDNKDLEEDKIVALFCHKTGYRRETVKRMVEELAEAGQI